MKNLIFIITALISTISIAQNAIIPDVNFKAYLVGNPSINTNGDTEIQITEAVAFTGHINCPNMNIASLVGIEEFTNITQLTAWSNQITFADLSDNTALTFVRLENNLLTNIILNRTNSLIYYLWLQQNQLTSFNASEHPLLEYFSIRFNQMTSIDVSQNPLLKYFGCGSNMLTSLDVTQNTALETLFFDNNGLTSIDLSQNAVLKNISCTNNQLQALDFSQNPLMELITCWNNQLTSINVLQNPQLLELNCSQNQLTVVNTSQNPVLDELFCDNNPITSLDVSANVALTELGVYTTPLTYLNVQNGNNSNFTYFGSSFTPSLICIFVDNANYSTTNWTNTHPNNIFVNNQAECTALSNESMSLDDSFTIYPNPASTDIHIKYDGLIDRVEVYDVAGQKLIDTSKIHISTNELKSGIYFMKIYSGSESGVKQFIKN
ncbi:MAG: T9SS type A sorting domain-containing protein [Nonlabens sp.]|uniref:leucine-rich repeat domain-containing protein n=1 Tax=Nonlabens sp. TaxID=1888209 RepID=UPI003EF1D943